MYNMYKESMKMHSILFAVLTVALLVGCNTEKAANEQPHDESMQQQMQGPAPEQDVSDAALVEIDPQVQLFVDKVKEFKAAYDAKPSDVAKTKLVNAYIAFGDYMTYESPISPRKGKYHRALIEYRHAMKLDPHNQKAMKEIQQIEEIYHSMGRPVPGDEV